MIIVPRHFDPARATTAQETDAAALVARSTDVPAMKHAFNTPPRDLREVDATYVAKRSLLGMYDPVAVEHRQVALPDATGREVYVSLVLHHYWDGSGLAYAVDRNVGKVRWFAFGCPHPAHSIHHCPGCGHRATIDSSD